MILGSVSGFVPSLFDGTSTAASGNKRLGHAFGWLIKSGDSSQPDELADENIPMVYVTWDKIYGFMRNPTPPLGSVKRWMPPQSVQTHILGNRVTEIPVPGMAGGHSINIVCAASVPKL